MPLSHDAAQRLLLSAEQAWPTWQIAPVGTETWSCERVAVAMADNNLLLDTDEEPLGLWSGDVVLTTVTDPDGNVSTQGHVANVASGVGTFLLTPTRIFGTVNLGSHLAGAFDTLTHPGSKGVAFAASLAGVTEVEYTPPKGMFKKTPGSIWLGGEHVKGRGAVTLQPMQDHFAGGRADADRCASAIRAAVRGAGGQDSAR